MTIMGRRAARQAEKAAHLQEMAYASMLRAPTSTLAVTLIVLAAPPAAQQPLAAAALRWRGAQAAVRRSLLAVLTRRAARPAWLDTPSCSRCSGPMIAEDSAPGHLHCAACGVDSPATPEQLARATAADAAWAEHIDRATRWAGSYA